MLRTVDYINRSALLIYLQGKSRPGTWWVPDVGRPVSGQVPPREMGKSRLGT